MARDGISGTYTVPEAEFVYEEVIDQDAVNHNFTDIATALTQSIANDGQTPVVANLPMSGFRHTNVGNATARTQYASAGQVQGDSICWCGTAGGTANALVLSPSPTVGAYAAGLRLRFLGGAFNTGPATVAVSGLTAKDIYQGGMPLVQSAIWQGSIHEIIYDGTRFHLVALGRDVPAVPKNVIVNPGFLIGQESTSATIAAGNSRYVLDQWYHVADATQATSVQQMNDEGGIDELPHSQSHYIRITSNKHGLMTQPIDNLRTLAGRTVTLTFWARASSNGATVRPYVYQYFGTGGSSAILTAFDSSPRILSTSWLRFRQSMTIPDIDPASTVGPEHTLTLRFDLVGDGMAIDFAYVQLQLGPNYTVIDRPRFNDDLMQCQWFWQSSYQYGVPPGTATYVGARHEFFANVIAPSNANVSFVPNMRIPPTVTLFSPETGAAGKIRNVDAGTDLNVIANSVSNKGFYYLGESGDFTTGHRGFIHWRANARY